MPNEECRYVWIDEDGRMKEIPEDEASSCCEAGPVMKIMKIVKHGNGKVSVYNAETCDKILEM